ncbi:MAG: hypothetical protein Q8R79_08205 [Legionellaceae bacterium]|nr:hypothetical protein [Legionellaceae bacterium]
MRLFFRKNQGASELRSSPARINHTKNLSERVIDELLQKNDILPEDVAIDALALQRRYALAEQISTQKEAGVFHVPLEDIDYVVCLSGRSGFYGQYEEAKDKVQRCQDHYDATDTVRRFLYAVMVAKQATLNNFKKGLFKIVPIYFNGVSLQNDELKEITHSQHSFNKFISTHGGSKDYFYPVDHIIVDSIPLDNTMGQAIGLSYYLHHHWPKQGINRYPNIVFVSSTYHVVRIENGIGSQSPIHTPAFFADRPEVLSRLTPDMQAYALAPGDTLKNARIMVLGCDRQYTAVDAWEKDLYCDMQASANYASLHRKNKQKIITPSIAAVASPNIITHQYVATQQALTNEKFFQMIRQRRLNQTLNFLHSQSNKDKDPGQNETKHLTWK